MSAIHNEILTKSLAGHPAPWAIFDADPALIERAIEEDSFLEKLDSVLCNQIETDTDREVGSLVCTYKACNEDQRMLIDATLVYLCGWSLKTLLEMARDEEVRNES